MRDSFIANHILRGLVRPQRKYECSINAVAGAVNSLYERSLDRMDVLMMASWDVDDVVAGNNTNKDVLEAIRQICWQKRLKVNGDVFLRSIPFLHWSSKRTWNEFKRNASDPKTVLIYHANNHYTLIAGYIEDEKQSYIVLAEHCPDWDPIRVISWKALRGQLLRHWGYGILRVRKI